LTATHDVDLVAAMGARTLGLEAGRVVHFDE